MRRPLPTEPRFCPPPPDEDAQPQRVQALRRLALFACAINPTEIEVLADGLTGPGKRTVVDFAREVLRWDSATRQARISQEFGPQPSAAARLKALVADCSPRLRWEIYRLLPPYHRSLFPELEAAPKPAEPAPPLMTAFAERLVKEAIR